MYGSPAGSHRNAFEIGDLLCEQEITMRYQKNELAAIEPTEMIFCGINRKYQWFIVGNFSPLL